MSSGHNLTATASNVYSSSDVPVTISATGTPSVTSTITVPLSGAGFITDVKLTGLDLSHSYIDDLTLKLTSPDGTEITLASGLCSYHDDINLSFDDFGANYFSIPCPPVDGQNYQPSQKLVAFTGEEAAGTWTLTIEDRANLDGGMLNAWSLEIVTDTYLAGPCVAPSCTYSFTSGSCSNYTVNAGETLCIYSDYSCNVGLNGGSIYVAPGVNFSPTMVGAIAGANVINNGILNFNSSANINGSTNFINNESGEISFNQNFNLDHTSTFVNSGVVDLTGSFTVRYGTSFRNDQELILSGNFTTESGGETTNNGRIKSQSGDINVNAGSTVINNCSFSATNNITINESVQNNGIFYVGLGTITINASSTLTNNGDVVSSNVFVNGDVEGSGNFWATGNTSLNSSGSFGSDGKGLNIYDSSSPPGSQLFDTENGILDASATNSPLQLQAPSLP